MSKKVLLKLGGRKHLGEHRWRSALCYFDEIYIACCFREIAFHVPDKRINLIELPRNFMNRKLTTIISKTKYMKQLNCVSWIAVYLLRLFNIKWLNKIKSVSYDKVLCSYGDYDWSDLICILARPVISQPIIRAYKETRIEYNFLEYQALKAADKIIFYNLELKKFLERKYGSEFFDKRNIMLNLDENALPLCILKQINYKEKYSGQDGLIHIVILSMRVDSSPDRKRDLTRYYYLDCIKELIKAGLVVHLHCAQYNDDHGINRYEELSREFPESFFIEEALEMNHTSTLEEWVKSCEILSRYDIGLLHNIVDTSKVSEFDRINIPHRLFAYEAAHVIPVIKRGENVVLEKMFKEKKCGFVYDRLEELKKISCKKFNYYNPTYEDYLTEVLDLEDQL